MPARRLARPRVVVVELTDERLGRDAQRGIVGVFVEGDADAVEMVIVHRTILSDGTRVDAPQPASIQRQ